MSTAQVTVRRIELLATIPLVVCCEHRVLVPGSLLLLVQAVGALAVQSTADPSFRLARLG